jgi:hypothetical protein
MAQFGIHADPYVTQAWKSKFLVDDPVTQSNTRGRVAFAKGGADLDGWRFVSWLSRSRD